MGSILSFPGHVEAHVPAPTWSSDPQEVVVKYLILIYSNPLARETWAAFSREERVAGLEYYAALTEELTESGELIATHALADPATAVRVTASDGRTTTSDGPFAEVKEHLAGFFLVDCVGRERAIEIAARIPEASLGLIEVRPVMELSAFEV
jgi:hypothetical protein